MANEKKNEVDSTSTAYDRMAPRWDKIDTLLKGTEAMRAAGEDYLPRHEAEGDRAYKNRLARAILYNYLELTINSLAGRPFDEEVTLGDDATPEMLELMEDVDLQGSNLHRFASVWFKTALAKGFSHVLVDFPKVAREIELADGSFRPRTLEDDRRENIRPYLVHIPPENIIFASEVIENGKPVLEHVRIKECVVERNKFLETEVTRIRVLERGWYQVWQKKDKTWNVVEEGATALPYIPLVTAYFAEREGVMLVKPPLMDLADLNVAHWQSDSDQRNILTVSRFPILAVSGTDDPDVTKIGPNNWLSTPDPAGKWYYVEHSGAAIKSGNEDLKALEDRMGSYGAEFLKKKPAAETASARILDEAGAISPLTAMCRNFKDALELVLKYMAHYLGHDDGPSVVMKTEFEEEAFGEGEVKDLIQLRTIRELSREAFIEELKRRRFLREDYDAEEDKALIDDEPPSDNDLAGMFPDNGGLPKKPGKPTLPE